MSTIELFGDEKAGAQNSPTGSPRPSIEKGTRDDNLISFSQKEPKPVEEENELVGFKGSGVLEADTDEENGSYDEDRDLYHTRDPQNFQPKLYTFKFPLKVQPKQTYTVLAPPFWILVDHLLAVVWHLYSGESTEKVGIVHLQWALEFSRWIKDENGSIPTVVRSLILVIEDALMEKYTNLSKIKPSKAGNVGSESTISGKENKFDTSVTLNDILSRTPAISPEKAMKKTGKKSVMSKASGPASDHSEKSKGEPAESSSDNTSLIKLLNYLRKYQAEKVKGETTFLSELEKAIEDFNNNEGDINEFLNKMEK